MAEKHPKTWVEIDQNVLRDNVATIRGLFEDDTLLMAVVKSNAYGHGLVECAHVFAEAGVDYLGVDSIEEGAVLRKSGIEAPILILNPTQPERADEIVALELEQLVADPNWLAEALETTDGLRVHLKVDTGMGRQGILPDTSVEVARRVCAAESAELVGTATHFCCADEPQRPQTKQQHQRFIDVLDAFKKEGVDPGIVHAALTAATVAFPETRHDMVRIGLGLYGITPFVPDVRDTWDAGTEAALEWKTRLSHIKTLPPDWCLGYGCTEKTQHEHRVGLLPVGYYDGYARALSSVGEVGIRNKRARIMGRISMNLTIIDLQDVPEARPGDPVTLIGDDVTAEELADHIGTISYEVVTRIGRHIPRIVV